MMDVSKYAQWLLISRKFLRKDGSVPGFAPPVVCAAGTGGFEKVTKI